MLQTFRAFGGKNVIENCRVLIGKDLRDYLVLCFHVTAEDAEAQRDGGAQSRSPSVNGRAEGGTPGL